MPLPFIAAAKVLKKSIKKATPAARKARRQLESIWNERGYTTYKAGKGRIKKLPSGKRKKKK